MATRQIFIDDLDGTEDGVETVTFGIDGLTYEIDLASTNQERLRTFLDEFVASARPVGRENGRKRATRRPANRKTQAAATIAEETAAIPATADLPDFDSKLARVWLKDNGFQAPTRGKLRAEVVLPYIESDAFKLWQEEQG